MLGEASKEVPVSVIAEHLEAHYRLSGPLRLLTGERDRNYRLEIDGHAAFVVKVAHPAESAEVIEAQSLAPNYVLSKDPSVPVQRTLLSRQQRATSVLKFERETRLVRVVDWLDGKVMAGEQVTHDLSASIGSTLARLGRALRGFSVIHAAQDLLWDLSNASRLSALLPELAGDPAYAHVESALSRYDAIVPVLGRLPKQAIHADFNPHNLLVDDVCRRIVGVLDFGDMQVAPRVCDLAIACAYLTSGGENSFEFVERAVEAYQVEDPIEGSAELLVTLIAMRHAMTILITEWRARRHPGSASYILRNNPAARRGLDSLAGVGLSSLVSKLSPYIGG